MNLQFLKLGGSLITDKGGTSVARRAVIERLAGEIASARELKPSDALVLGHGSGSFGHAPARQYNTRQGVQEEEQWAGFAEVWYQASALNRIVIEALHAAGLPALAFPLSGAVVAHDGQIAEWDIRPIELALEHGLLPVVYGDVAFDNVRGGTILSTEDIFDFLAPRLRPVRILQAGLDPVWADYPANTRVAARITPATLKNVEAALGGSAAAADVTGGMAAKVRQTLAQVQALPGCEGLIFSGTEAGAVRAALLGENPGTCLSA
ncbi:MAG: isopentenyl phosphate kinase family protein [Chloroflexi bacterium]|nr:isopentenyl phosphate kinase family protein [Chloroflexota bacterium]